MGYQGNPPPTLKIKQLISHFSALKLYNHDLMHPAHLNSNYNHDLMNPAQSQLKVSCITRRTTVILVKLVHRNTADLQVSVIL